MIESPIRNVLPGEEGGDDVGVLGELSGSNRFLIERSNLWVNEADVLAIKIPISSVGKAKVHYTMEHV